MGGREHNALPAAILAAFTPITSDGIARSMHACSERDWESLGTWLHASGLALYFLDELKTRGIESSLPPTVLHGLERNLADNRERTAALAREFVSLNSEFAAANLDYICVKGFSLGLPYCKDATLRSQFDLDFWIPEDRTVECAALMRQLGYEVKAATRTLECHSGGTAYPKFRDFYKPPVRRSVEIHLRSREEFDTLPRAAGVLHGAIFPTLSCDRIFVEQALHLTKHLTSEWTRASWMLELCNAMRAEEFGSEFFSGVGAACPERQKILVGIAVASCARVFRGAVPEALNWALTSLPAEVAQWIDEYAPEVATAPFPGTKFYMLLERELAKDAEQFHSKRRAVLLPLRIPGYIAAGRFRGMLRNFVPHARYAAMRLAFHVREGARLVRAERRWSQRKLKGHAFAAREGGSVA